MKILKNKGVVINKLNQKLELDTTYTLSKSGAFPFTEENTKKMLILEVSGMGWVKLLLIKKGVRIIKREIFLLRF